MQNFNLADEEIVRGDSGAIVVQAKGAALLEARYEAWKKAQMSLFSCAAA